tara:strand:- start:46 stop:663 length:618 start_codon:yes stop_codon:yes gene_type:complete
VNVEDSFEEIRIFFALVVLTEKPRKTKEKTNCMPLSKRWKLLKQDTVMKKWNENKGIIINIIILLVMAPLIVYGQDENYQGQWSAAGEAFENTLTLEKINEKEDIYKFSFNGWRKSYDTFTKQIIRFPGSMTEDRFIVQIIDNYGYYTDETLVEVDDLPLYNEGEERCKVFFEFDKKTINVITKDCSMIYAGYGVYFDGEYKRSN